jgi:putative flavoprotein involved in K+ transport
VVPTAITTLDLRAAGIRSVVWATGFRDDFGWVHLPVFDHAGKPVHRRGVTCRSGLYFLGLSWLHKHKSASLIGAGEDAEYLAEHLLAGCKKVRLRAQHGSQRERHSGRRHSSVPLT